MALTASQARVLDMLRDPTSKAAKFSRVLDWFILPIVIFALIAAFHIHFMLLGGDWDFWVDWKDRQYWVAVTPIMMMILVGAVQGIFWHHFRLPIGATVMCLLLVIGEWISRYFGFFLWSHFPMSLIWPASVIASGIVLDMVLTITGSYMMTALFGAMGFALIFPLQNWPILAAFRLPMEHQGELISVADYVGFVFSRTATPEYLRIIERGTLRTFGGESTIVAAFFSGFICMIVYFLSWHAGVLIANLGYINNTMKTYMGYHRLDNVKKEDGLGNDSVMGNEQVR